MNQEIIEKIEQVSTNDGIITIYKKNNFPTNLGIYENNKKSGLWIEYYDNGQIKNEGMYKNDIKDGLWTEYNYVQNISTIKSLDSLVNNKTLWACCNHGEPMGHMMYYNENGEIINQKFINEKISQDTSYMVTFIDFDTFNESVITVSNQSIRKNLNLNQWQAVECHMNGCIDCMGNAIEGCFQEKKGDILIDEEWGNLFSDLDILSNEVEFGDSLVVEWRFEKKYFFERLVIPNTQTNSRTDQITFIFRRPSIPIEADDESEIITIDFIATDIAGFGNWGAPAASASKKYMWVSFDKYPTSKKQINPKYPDDCKRAGIEGKVTISFWVDVDGGVDQSSIKIVQSVPCLDQVCIDAIKKSKWRPARQGKKKIGAFITKSFNFTLN